MSNVVLVMKGNIRDFDVPTILQVVSLSRRCTVISLWGPDSQQTGEIKLKAGQLLEARFGSLEGTRAFRNVVKCNQHATFRVERDPENAVATEPLGRIGSLLMAALQDDEDVVDAPPLAEATGRTRRPAPDTARYSKGMAPGLPLAGNANAGSAQEAVEVTVKRPSRALAKALAEFAQLSACAIAKRSQDETIVWERHETAKNPEALAHGIQHLLRLSTTLGDWSADSNVSSVIEVGDEVAVVFTAGGLDVIYRFASKTPLGLARLVASRAHDVAVSHFGD